MRFCEELTQRMEKLVRRIANPGSVDHNAPEYRSCADEARSIISDLSKLAGLVDADQIEARQIALKHRLHTVIDGMTFSSVSRGEADGTPQLKAIVEAIKSRALLAEGAAHGDA